MKLRMILGAVALLICAAPLADAQPYGPPPPPRHGAYMWHGKHYEHRARAYDRHHHSYWRYY
jgi:hypothetical protein